MQQQLCAQPERTAWAVIWSAFLTFCLLVVAVPLGARYMLRYSTAARPATLQVLEGTVRVVNPVTGRLEAATRGSMPVTVGEGFVIYLDDKATADLRFFDGSYVHILPDSDLAVERLRAPRFDAGVAPNAIALRMTKGRLRMVTANTLRPGGLEFVLRLPELGAEARLKADGLYGAEVQLDGGEVSVHLGSAVVSASGSSVSLLPLERTTLEPGQPPAPAIARARDLVRNGDFSQPLSEGWAVYNDQGNDGESVDGIADLVVEEGIRAVRFFRTGSNRNHCKTIIEQAINRELPDPVSSLVIRANVKIVSQSLPGGGYLASEFPLMIRLRYRDMYGSENEFVQGFYTGDPQENPTAHGREVPPSTWKYFESGNLLETLKPRPFRIVWLQVYASGWDYESMIHSIGLEVR